MIDSQYITFFIILLGLSMVYEKLKVKDEAKTSAYYYKMVDKYLLNNTSLGSNDKPILWIHLQNDNTILPEVNSRSWISFYSRDTKDLNQPYQNLTIKSIINKCGDDFNIALIDDKCFKKIIPGWNIDFSKVANPVKTHLRLLAQASILHTYGGILVPSSFICFKSLLPLCEANEGRMFAGSFLNKTSTANMDNKMISSPVFMGCNLNNNEMGEFIKYLELLNSADFVAEMDFLGKPNQWLNNSVEQGLINSVNGRYIGTQKECGDPIYIEELVSSSYVNLDSGVLGLYIPWNELLNRTALNWFVRMSPQQVLESDTVIGKYLLVNQ